MGSLLAFFVENMEQGNISKIVKEFDRFYLKKLNKLIRLNRMLPQD